MSFTKIMNKVTGTVKTAEMAVTDFLKLWLPNYDNTADIEKLNDNFKSIDGKLKQQETSLEIKESTLAELKNKVDENFGLGDDPSGIVTIQQEGAKIEGYRYFDTANNVAFKCIKNNSLTYADAEYYTAIDNDSLSDKLQNLSIIKRYYKELLPKNLDAQNRVELTIVGNIAALWMDGVYKKDNTSFGNIYSPIYLMPPGYKIIATIDTRSMDITQDQGAYIRTVDNSIQVIGGSLKRLEYISLIFLIEKLN